MMLCVRAIPLLLLAMPCVAAKAADADVGRGVVCDTRSQVERFIALRGGGEDARGALRTVNDESHSHPACSFVLVKFTNDQTVASLVVQGRLISIMKITVQAVGNGSAWMPVPSIVQYTAAAEKGQVI